MVTDAKKVHNLLYEVGSLDRLADSGLGFPSNVMDSMRDMTHDEENVTSQATSQLLLVSRPTEC